MAETYITRIRTEAGDLQIDYNALANKPSLIALDTGLTTSGKAADAKAVGDRLNTITANIDKISLGTFGVTASKDELNYMDGVTSNVQTQLNGKAASNHTHSDLASATHKHSVDDIISGTLSSDKLPVIPIDKGGTGAADATNALINFGIETGTWKPVPNEADGSIGDYYGHFVKVKDMITVTFCINCDIIRISSEPDNYFYIDGKALPYVPDPDVPLFFGNGHADGLCTLDPNDCFVGWAIDTSTDRIYARTMYVKDPENDNIHASRYMYSPSSLTNIYLSGSITYKMAT